MDSEILEMTEQQADVVMTESDVAEVPEVAEAETEEPECTDEQSEEQSPVDPTAQIEELRAEIQRLNEQLTQKQEYDARVAAQLEELGEVFPEADVKALPESVWESVRAGNSLAAAYALYERRMRNTAERSSGINAKNTYSSAGKITGAAPEFFTPDEVRTMSREQVRANYSKIIDSMKKWN